MVPCFMQENDLCFRNHIFVLYFQIQLTAPCQQVFLDPKKFLGVASVADAVEYLHSGRSVGKVRRFIRVCNSKQTNLFYCCSEAACNFQCYPFRSLFAWIHPTARPLLSCSLQTYELHCQQKIFFLRFLVCQTEDILVL
jgi:hypothetical protein